MIGKVANIQRFSLYDGPGIRTIVFLQGCPLRCGYCHNPEMQQDDGGMEMSVEEVIKEVEKDRPFYNVSGGGLTLSGGEPLMQPDFSSKLLATAKSLGLSTCVETSGAGSADAICKVAEYTDIFLWDLKISDFQDVPLSKLKIAESSGARIQLRTVLLPDLDRNSVEQQLLSVAQMFSCCDYIELLPYNDLSEAKTI